jgi:hypothetical protein
MSTARVGRCLHVRPTRYLCDCCEGVWACHDDRDARQLEQDQREGDTEGGSWSRMISCALLVAGNPDQALWSCGI